MTAFLHRAGVLPLALLLSACATQRPTVISQFEDFESSATHSRSFSASDARTCEAARRALLSQGYVIGAAGAESVQGKKSYQPQPEVHVEVEFRIVCAREGRAGKSTLAFVSALQDRYALRKTNSAASLGVGALGSVSLPFSSSDDSLVKVASETITAPKFYDRFFGLVERYLAGQPDAPVEDLAPPPMRGPALPATKVAPAPTPSPAPSPAPAPAPAPAPTPAAAPPAVVEPAPADVPTNPTTPVPPAGQPSPMPSDAPGAPTTPAAPDLPTGAASAASAASGI